VSSALTGRGLACLRFDYGPWDGGRGERTDVVNAIGWARERYDRVGCFGYSFGATVGLLAASAVLGFALFVIQPLYQATVAEYSPAEARGLSYGYTYLAVFGVGALGASLAGAVLEYAGPPLLFGVLAGIAAVGALLSGWLVLRSPSPRHVQRPTGQTQRR
jgi:MFS family permease